MFLPAAAVSYDLYDLTVAHSHRVHRDIFFIGGKIQVVGHRQPSGAGADLFVCMDFRGSIMIQPTSDRQAGRHTKMAAKVNRFFRVPVCIYPTTASKTDGRNLTSVSKARLLFSHAKYP